MQYFTSDMWGNLNNMDSEAQIAALDRWNKAWEQYREYMESIRPYLSARKWKTIMQCHNRLHDCIIESIEINHRQYGRRSVVDIKFDLCEKNLVFTNVTRFLFTINNQTAFLRGSYSWGYCEFELMEEKRMRVTILCDVSNQINIEFENLRFMK